MEAKRKKKRNDKNKRKGHAAARSSGGQRGSRHQNNDNGNARPDPRPRARPRAHFGRDAPTEDIFGGDQRNSKVSKGRHLIRQSLKNLERISNADLWLEELSGGEPVAVLEVLRSDTLNDRLGRIMCEENLSRGRVFHISKIMAKLCEVEYETLVVTLLQRVCRKEYIDKLCLFIVQMEENKDICSNVENFFEDLCSFFYGMLRLMPTLACERLATLIKVTMQAVPSLPHRPDTTEKLQFLKEKLSHEVEKRETETVKISAAEEALQYQNPPNSFREMSIEPTLEDIAFSTRPFLRPNVIRGPYQNVEHYLDVQFRLLREDFLRPLREGFAEYLSLRQSHNSRVRVDNIRIYPKVQLLEVHLDNSSIGVTLMFDPDGKLGKSRIDWSQSKRFMTGTLLILSNDNFVSNFVLAIVSQRNETDLMRGHVTVELENYDAVCGHVYSMVESQVYFGAYAPVLEALKAYDELSFPLKDFIVYGKSDNLLPSYLINEKEMKLTIKTLTGAQDVDAKSIQNWPNKEELGLNESQYSAFGKALTSRVMLIQGPPGTGKTFIGLKVANTLLAEENITVWRPEGEKRPLIIVCLTNHALDQFLVGLLPATKSIIRLGGGCKEPQLDEYTIKNHARNYGSSHGWSLVQDFKTEFSKLKHDIEKWTRVAESLRNFDGIINIFGTSEFNILSEFASECFLSAPAYVYIAWLLGYDFGPDVLRLRPSLHHFLKLDTWNAMKDIALFTFKSVRTAVIGIKTYLRTLEKTIHDAEEKLLQTSRMGTVAEEEEMCGFKNAFYSGSFYYDGDECFMIDLIQRAEMQRQCLQDLNMILRLRDCIRACFQNKSPELVKTVVQTRDVWSLTQQERLVLYSEWSRKLVEILKNRTSKLQLLSVKTAKELKQSRMIEDQSIMQRCQVIGMTTTYAAKNHKVLKHVKPRIAIVEEAAEVLEAHVVASLGGDVQHLILIGDHQQLRPNPASYALGKKFHLEVSLFERLINNKVDCVRLSTQHRMRPEIASLICPTIYPDLMNHKSVTEYPSIRGVANNVYFIDHLQPQELVSDIQSFRNKHEALFVSGLVRHLKLQGYEPSSVTVLCTYTGQLFYLKKISKTAKHIHLSEVRVTVVDNFQGEENDIIILSLVRSNDANEVGFLKTENRVCVALSRARHGLFIIGNMTSLTGKGEGVWIKIKEQLVKQNAIGDALKLKCEVHGTTSSVKCEEDFKIHSPLGGCRLKCEVLMSCGHYCGEDCHVLDREHRGSYQLRCKMPCEKPRCSDLQHICPKLCYQECGPCTVPKEERLPACGHRASMPCHMQPSEFRCREEIIKTLTICGHEREMLCYEQQDLSGVRCSVPCEFRLSCGHACRLTCHILDDPEHEKYLCSKPCGEIYDGCKQNHRCQKKCHEDCGLCPILVSKTLVCGHDQQIPCHEAPLKSFCKRRCERVNKCGHPCQKQCRNECKPCIEQVNKTLPSCGHKLEMACGVDVSTAQCLQKCKQNLSCGHRCPLRCSDPCLKPTECREGVQLKLACGHLITVACKELLSHDASSPALLSRCSEPCREKLLCQHSCSGTCGRCAQGRLHVQCKAINCNRTLICGHKCKSPCSVPCPPCIQPCPVRCEHNTKCYGICGDRCTTSCTKKCLRRCEHQACDAQCGQICSFDYCNEPCNKVVRRCEFRHPCVGFCGERCVCECDVSDGSFLPGSKVESRESGGSVIRFVLLPDCKHVFESSGLEAWLHGRQDALLFEPLLCPSCGTAIVTFGRFRNYMKKNAKQLAHTRNTFLEPRDKFCAHIEEEMQNLKSLDLSNSVYQLTRIRNELVEKLESIKKQIVHHKTYKKNNYSLNLHDILLKVRPLLEHAKMFRAVALAAKKLRSEWGEGEAGNVEIQNLLKTVLTAVYSKDHHFYSLSSQEAGDFSRELWRLECLLKLCWLEKRLPVTSNLTGNSLEEYKTMCSAVRTWRPYCDETQHKVLVERVESFTLKLLGDSRSAERFVKLERPLAAAAGFALGSWLRCRQVPEEHVHVQGSECIGCKQGDANASSRDGPLQLQRLMKQVARMRIPKPKRGSRR